MPATFEELLERFRSGDNSALLARAAVGVDDATITRLYWADAPQRDIRTSGFTPSNERLVLASSERSESLDAKTTALVAGRLLLDQASRDEYLLKESRLHHLARSLHEIQALVDAAVEEQSQRNVKRIERTERCLQHLNSTGWTSLRGPDGNYVYYGSQGESLEDLLALAGTFVNPRGGIEGLLKAATDNGWTSSRRLLLSCQGSLDNAPLSDALIESTEWKAYVDQVRSGYLDASPFFDLSYCASIEEQMESLSEGLIGPTDPWVQAHAAAWRNAPLKAQMKVEEVVQWLWANADQDPDPNLSLRSIDRIFLITMGMRIRDRRGDLRIGDHLNNPAPQGVTLVR